VDAVVQLGRETLVEGRPFTAPKNTQRDGAMMREMLASMRGFARSWLASPSPGPGALVYESDAAGLRTWIRVPDRAALLTTPELTTIGFFGQPRDGVDHAPIHQLETAIVETLEEVPGPPQLLQPRAAAETLREPRPLRRTRRAGTVARA
jgi:hypothetical protein